MDLKDKTAVFFAVNGIAEEGSLGDGGKVVVGVKLFTIVRFDQLQRFLQLQHRSKGVLAGVGAGTVADKVINPAVPVKNSTV